jgi:hypothetical protein
VCLEAMGMNVVQPIERVPPKKGYSNSDDCPCVFIRRSSTGFCIISLYFDNLNIIGHAKDIDETHNHLKTEFEMKDLGRTKFYLGLQLEHLHMGYSHTPICLCP